MDIILNWSGLGTTVRAGFKEGGSNHAGIAREFAGPECSREFRLNVGVIFPLGSTVDSAEGCTLVLSVVDCAGMII